MSEQVITDVPQANQAEAQTSLFVSVGLLSTSVLGFFFLPWMLFLGNSLSGFDIVRIEEFGGTGKALLLIPGASLVSLIAAITRSVQTKQVGIVAGSMPFIALIYFFVTNGADLFQILGVGAYLTLFAAMLLVGCCLSSLASRYKAR